MIFYPFDLETYEKVQGSYMDYKKDVFGDLAWDQNQLVDLIGEYVRNGFREKPEFSGRREELLPYRDNDNSKRIYEYIANAQIPDKLKRRLKEKKF